MGHRAIVAYERPPAQDHARVEADTADTPRGRPVRYTVRYSHWGAHDYRIRDAITARTPFGRDPTTTDAFRTRTGPGPGASTTTEPLVERRPIGTADDVPDIAQTYVDPVVHEAVFTVTPRYDVTVLHPLSLDWDDRVDRRRGAIVELAGHRDPAPVAGALRAWNDGRTNTVVSDRTGAHTDSATGAGADERFDRWLTALRDAFPTHDVYPIRPDGSMSRRVREGGDESERETDREQKRRAAADS